MSNSDTIITSLENTSLTEDITTMRFSSAVWYEAMKERTITIVGVGGIGSYVAFLASRLKPKRIIMYDDDKVDNTNLAGQLYSKNDVDNFKTYALANMMKQYSNYYSIIGASTKFDISSEISDITICGLDNMSSRELVFKAWRDKIADLNPDQRKQYILIDGRLAAEEFQIFCITGDDTDGISKYKEEWLFSDEEAAVTMCSYKQTSYMAAMIGSFIINLLVNHVTNIYSEGYKRNLPFLTSFEAGNLYLNIVI